MCHHCQTRGCCYLVCLQSSILCAGTARLRVVLSILLLVYKIPHYVSSLPGSGLYCQYYFWFAKFHIMCRHCQAQGCTVNVTFGLQSSTLCAVIARLRAVLLILLCVFTEFHIMCRHCQAQGCTVNIIMCVYRVPHYVPSLPGSGLYC